MKTRVKTSVIIYASTTAVFKYLADTRLHYAWNPHMQDVKPLGKLHKGDVYESLNFLFGVRLRTVNKVTKFVENSEMELKNQTGMLDYRVHYQIRALSAKESEITCLTNIIIKGSAFQFARPMLEHLARRELNTDLGLLKQAVEQHLT